MDPVYVFFHDSKNLTGMKGETECEWTSMNSITIKRYEIPVSVDRYRAQS